VSDHERIATVRAALPQHQLTKCAFLEDCEAGCRAHVALDDLAAKGTGKTAGRARPNRASRRSIMWRRWSLRGVTGADVAAVLGAQ